MLKRVLLPVIAAALLAGPAGAASRTVLYEHFTSPY